MAKYEIPWALMKKRKHNHNLVSRHVFFLGGGGGGLSVIYHIFRMDSSKWTSPPGQSRDYKYQYYGE